jgi:hypothetical protein
MPRGKNDWSRVLKDYHQSGATQRAFCEVRKLSLNTLQYHLQKQRASAELTAVAPKFVELSAPRAPSTVEIEIILPSGAALRLRG